MSAAVCASGLLCALGSLFSGFSWATFQQVLLTILPVWFFGALTGYLLPRPKSSTASNALLLSILDASAWRRAVLALHGAIILRDVWYHITCPGTARAFTCAVLRWFCGKGWSFDFPGAHEAAPGLPSSRDGSNEGDKWHVTEKDLVFFHYRTEGTGDLPGAQAWALMMDREIPNIVKYQCWRRMLPDGKTEYKSVTYSPNATAQEYMDMFLDDDVRPTWDAMIIEHQVLEHGDFEQRQQVVRWVRRFPFSFISDREYVIARRMFQQGSDLYGITKAVDHPRATRSSDLVRMDVFYSMWRSRTVPCPWGSDNPACETVLLHHEQFKIPENLARFAVKHGMWPFVRKLSQETPRFVEQRRARCAPDASDPAAYGAGHAPNPPVRAAVEGAAVLRRADTSAVTLSSMASQSSSDLGSSSSSASDYGSESGSPTSANHRSRGSNRKLKGLAAFAIASGVALLLRRSASNQQLKSKGSNGSLMAAGTHSRRHRAKGSAKHGDSALEPEHL